MDPTDQFVGGAGRVQRAVTVDGDEGAEVGVEVVDPAEVVLEELDRADVAPTDGCRLRARVVPRPCRFERSLRCHAGMYLPPSITSTCPVTKRASSLAKYTAAPVRSSACSTPWHRLQGGEVFDDRQGDDPARGLGVDHAGRDAVDGDAVAAELSGGELGEPDDAVLRLRVVEHVQSGELVGAEAARVVVGGGRGLVDDAPVCWRTMCGATARVMSQTPWRLTSKTRRRYSSL